MLNYVCEDDHVVEPHCDNVIVETKYNQIIIVIDGKMGCIGKNKGISIPCKHDALWRFNEDGVAPACLGEKWGVIDTKAEVVIPFVYDHSIMR